VSPTPDRSDEFSRLERAALAHWQAPSPAPDFADRVLARALAEAAPAPPPRGRLAVAALALLVLGGALSIRSMVGGPGAVPTDDQPSALGGYDGGLRPEVSSGATNDVASEVSSTEGDGVDPGVRLEQGGAGRGDGRSAVRDGVSRHLSGDRPGALPGDRRRDPRRAFAGPRGQPS
jgi:hypothetical protein